MPGTSLSDLKSGSMWRAVFAELIGTFILVLLGCGSCLNGVGNVGISLCFGLTIMSVVWAIADVSGGHINPAVTAAFLVTRHISIIRAIFYMVAQVVGAIIGAAVLRAVTPDDNRATLGTPSLADGVNTVQGFFVEYLITFIFVFVIFSAVDSQRKDSIPAPIIIGSALLACHLWAVSCTFVTILYYQFNSLHIITVLTQG